MKLVFLNIIGWIVANWRLVAITVGVVAVLIVFGMVMRSCNNQPVKFDEKTIQEAKTAIAEQDRQKMTEILANSAVVEKQINANLANADNEKLKTLSEARKRAAAMTNEELAAELERRVNQ